MNTNIVLENDDIFCGDTFVMTLNRFDTLDIDINNGRLFINHTFVKDFGSNEVAQEAIEAFVANLTREEIDLMMSVA
jgi:hypothetical protein